MLEDILKLKIQKMMVYNPVCYFFIFHTLDYTPSIFFEFTQLDFNTLQGYIKCGTATDRWNCCRSDCCCCGQKLERGNQKGGNCHRRLSRVRVPMASNVHSHIFPAKSYILFAFHASFVPVGCLFPE